MTFCLFGGNLFGYSPNSTDQTKDKELIVSGTFVTFVTTHKYRLQSASLEDIMFENQPKLEMIIIGLKVHSPSLIELNLNYSTRGELPLLTPQVPQ